MLSCFSHVTNLCEPARLLCPWDSSGKNTGVGYHFLCQGNLPDAGIEPESLTSPALVCRFFTTRATREFNSAVFMEEIAFRHSNRSHKLAVLMQLLLLLLSRFSRVQLLVAPWAAAHQAPPSMGFFRQEYWSGLQLPSPVLMQTSV